jgi:hypothetical protein
MSTLLPSEAGEVPPSYGGGGVMVFRTAGAPPAHADHHDNERAGPFDKLRAGSPRAA